MLWMGFFCKLVQFSDLFAGTAAGYGFKKWNIWLLSCSHMTCFQYDTSICATSPWAGIGNWSDFRTKSKIKITFLQGFFFQVRSALWYDFEHGPMSICSRNQQQGEISPVTTGAECSVLQNPILPGTAEKVPVCGRNMEPVVRRGLLKSIYHKHKDFTEAYKKARVHSCPVWWTGLTFGDAFSALSAWRISVVLHRDPSMVQLHITLHIIIIIYSVLQG